MTTGLPTIAIYACRACQFALVAVAGIVVLGGLLGNMHLLAFGMLLLFALFCGMCAGLVELLAVWPIRRRWGGESDG